MSLCETTLFNSYNPEVCIKIWTLNLLGRFYYCITCLLGVYSCSLHLCL